VKRVLVLSPPTAGRSEVIDEIGAGQLAAVDISPELRFEFRPAKLSPPLWDTYHDLIVADFAMLEAGLSAQDEGFDAVCIETISDSGVDALRSVLDIPVLGPGRGAYLTALMLGNRFSILNVWEHWWIYHERRLREYRLLDRLASFRSIGFTAEDLDFGDHFGKRRDELLARLADTALRCVEEDGADVIVMGSTTMYTAYPHLRANLPVPVIEPASLVFKLAEFVLGLGLTHSRHAYRKQDVRIDDVLHAMGDRAAELGGGG
jgi:allantoin racemase